MNEKQAEILKTTAAARAARERLNGTVSALQSRLDRRTITRRAQKRLSRTGSGMAEVARANPAAAAGLAVIALLLVRRVGRRRAQIAALPAFPPSSDRS